MKGGRTKSKQSSFASYSATSPSVEASEAGPGDQTRIWYDCAESADSISIEYTPGFGNQDSVVLAVADMDALSSIDISLSLTHPYSPSEDRNATSGNYQDHLSLSNAENEPNSLDRKQPMNFSAREKTHRWKAKIASKPDK